MESMMLSCRSLIPTFLIIWIAGHGCSPESHPHNDPWTIDACTHRHEANAVAAVLALNPDAGGVLATVEICNQTNRDVNLRRFGLPFVGPEGRVELHQPLFYVMTGGTKVPYHGIRDHDQGTIRLAPGQRLRFQVDLSTFYELHAGKEYKVSFGFAIDGDDLNHPVDSNEVVFIR